ncbi:MAG: hypothetical protein AB7O32_16040 [Vicinamibacterales bacterium]
MAKLDFLSGRWAGEATVTRGPGQTLTIAQSEAIEFKLDGLVLLVEGTGRDASGGMVFNALATIAFDPGTSGYRIRAYRDGNYVDAPLTLLERGFEWGFSTGPVVVTNRMRLDTDGQWIETTDIRMGDGREVRSMEMRLVKR